MGKHEHEIEYRQLPGDFEKNSVRIRCVGCDYESFSVAEPGLKNYWEGGVLKYARGTEVEGVLDES